MNAATTLAMNTILDNVRRRNLRRTIWEMKIDEATVPVELTHDAGIDLLSGTVYIGACAMHVTLFRVEDIVIEEARRRIIVQRCASDNRDVVAAFEETARPERGYLHTVSLRPAGWDADEDYVVVMHPSAE